MGTLALAGGMLAGTLAPAVAESAAAPSGDVGTLSAPVGKQCGAYLTGTQWGSQLRYYHCGNSVIEVEIDMRGQPNRLACVGPWQDVYLDNWEYADNAWYDGNTC
ncbi:DUF6355 family natural product biosynthesis protein [Nonomuraea sp. NPDC049684]|uniref:DUF6355 family natural product biosynthesis protein n=1 Tax=unclassified Nonomuraea TaxID=2593643 RepID=UPI0037A2C549